MQRLILLNSRAPGRYHDGKCPWFSAFGKMTAGMIDLDSDLELDASAATSQEEWLSMLARIGEEAGHFHAIGDQHKAVFLDNSATLLVSFDRFETAQTRPRKLPVGMDLADDCDWSHLCLLSQGGPWYRDPAVYAHFDRLIDDGFFEDFDRVLFYGAGPSGHAAAAFSIASPGARVLLVNPVATLNPGLASWETRYRAARRLDFTSRFGFAPDMVDGALAATVICDPVSPADAMQASLFHAPHVAHLSARFGGPDLEACLARLGILNHLIVAAMDGVLDEARFGSLWRKRREDTTYLRQLQAATVDHPAREAMLCRNVVARLNQNRFKRRLAELTAAS